jgi:hypothetical protein
VEKIDDLLCQQRKLETFSHAAREQVVQRFSIQSEAYELNKLYTSLVACVEK